MYLRNGNKIPKLFPLSFVSETIYALTGTVCCRSNFHIVISEISMIRDYDYFLNLQPVVFFPQLSFIGHVCFQLLVLLPFDSLVATIVLILVLSLYHIE